MTQHLFLFQIGPVQSFIAAARRTQDLYVGSRILSILASAGVKAALSQGVDLLFPASDQDGNLPSSIPHRFAFISDHKPTEIALSIEESIRQQWNGLAELVRVWLVENGAKKGAWQDIYDNQIADWLEVYWVTVPYNGSHTESFKRAVRAMAARKVARNFPQVSEEGQKCTLSGAQTALPIDWRVVKKNIHDNKDIVIRPNERLGALATLKRFLQFAATDDTEVVREVARRVITDENDKKFFKRVEHFPDTTSIAGGKREEDLTDKERRTEEPLYFAVLHMDGDNMGARLSQLPDIEKHQEFSKLLAKFADSLKQFIDEEIEKARGLQKREGKGGLVYSGGDDVLALLPLWAVLPVADAIRQKFAAEIGGTMSAGISITPHKHPFSFALDEARLAEKRAKSHYGRNAVVIRQNIGQIREAGAPWEVISFAYKMQFCFENQFISGKYGFDLLELAHQLAVESIVPPEAITDEAIRILKRRKADGIDPQIIIELAEDISRFGNMPMVGWERLANWIIIARFLAKQRADLSVLNTQGESA